MLFLIPISCFILILLIIKLSDNMGFLSERISNEPRKIHTSRIPRVGGLALLPISISILYLELNLYQNLILVSSLLLILGLYEDIKKNTSSYLRFVIITLLVSYFVITNNIIIVDFDNSILNIITKSYFFSLIFIILGLLFFINGFNFIDGTNGLMLGTSIIILSNILFFSYGVSEQIFNLILLILPSIIILFFFNFPFGKIFSGDGGSYFIGFIVGNICILASMQEVLSSPHLACLVFYPIAETFVTFWRRIFLNKTNPFKPDELHLHILVYKKVSNSNIYGDYSQANRSSLSSIFILFFLVLTSFLTVLLDTYMNLLIVFFIYSFTYLIFYLFTYKSWRE